MSGSAIRLGILFGGRSAEHPISVRSTRSLACALAGNADYKPAFIGIAPSGRWVVADDLESLITDGHVDERRGRPVLLPGIPGAQLMDPSGQNHPPPVDICFPMLHGSFGEDGCIQGLLELAQMPYVGCGVGASAVAMDKELAKSVFAAKGLTQTDFFVVRHEDWQADPKTCLDDCLKLAPPLFVKPARLGSSIGISRAETRAELEAALTLALTYDTKAIVEQSAEPAREIECAVLGNHQIETSLPGEIMPGEQFYDYADKYLNSAATLHVPADLTEAETRAVQDLARQAYRAIDGCGMARVDCFLKPDGQLLINELNTIPGFTDISLYPRMWQAGGLDYAALVKRLVELGFEMHRGKQKLTINN